MLSIGKLGKGQGDYYIDKVAEGAEEYYSGEGELPGTWIGDAADRLGLAGDVEADQLTAMLDGRDPVSGGALLGRNGLPPTGGVPGFDLTFSAPKSASLLAFVGGPVASSHVQQAHGEAVAAALAYMQRNACWTRRGAGGAEFLKGEGYLAAAYRHRSSRNGDPQLHTHVLIANATRAEGRWTRLHHPSIYEHAKTAGYIYEAHLRAELTRRLAVQWREPRNGIAEIEGFKDEHLRAFSTRRAEIERAAGPDASPRSMQVATLATRKPKEEEIDQGTLLERWRERAREIGLDRESVAEIFEPLAHMQIPEPHERVRELPAEPLAQRVSASTSHFDRRDVVQAIAGSLQGGASGEEIERWADAFLASDAVIAVAESQRGQRFTTRRIWELEREALGAAERMATQGPAHTGELIAARALASRPALNAGQREMVHRLLTRSEGVVVVIGEAGTGKTYALSAAAEGWAQAGTELRAAAPTWRAANVMRAEGLPATSLAKLLRDVDRAESGGGEGLEQGSVLVVDEAGMVGSADLARLIAHAEAAEAKLVLLGDPEQLGEIEAGGLFRALAERSDPVHLDEVIRHEHELDRDAAHRIRSGEGREALGLYESGERITVAPDAEARREAMLSDWHRAYERGEDAVMVAKRNVEVERLNAMAREVRREAGRLGAQEIEVGDARFAAGDQVITRVNDHAAHLYNRERWAVESVDPETGSAVLRGLDQERAVEVGPDYLARTNPYNDAPALEHAYAVTTYSAQGSTVDRAFVMADPSMDKQELYVAASRSRGETRIYATPEVQPEREEIAPGSAYLREGIPHIGEAAERDRAQLAAHEVALRDRYSALPDRELIERTWQLNIPAGREQSTERSRASLEQRIEKERGELPRFDAERERVGELRRRERGEVLEWIERREARHWERLRAVEAELAETPPPGDFARRELHTVEQVLAERRDLAIHAARIAPPAYVTAELGERPADPVKREAWDRGVSQIEGYRQRNGVSDPARAFGPEAKQGGERSRQENAMRRLRNAQRALGREVEASRSLDRGISLGIGR